MISFVVFGFLTVLFTFSLLTQWRKASAEKRRLPPGPKKLPFIGNLHQLGTLPHRSLQHLSRKHGPLMFLQLGSIPTLVVSSADMAKEIFKNYDSVFSGKPLLHAANRLGYGSSVSFAPYGEYWREMRKIMVSELLSPKRVQSFEAVRFDEVKRMLQAVSLSPGPVDLSELTLSLTNNVVCRVALGKRDRGTGDANKVYRMLKETQEMLGGFFVDDFFPQLGWLNKFSGLESRLEKNFRDMDRFYDEVIKEHVDKSRESAETEHEDVVDVLLQVQKDPSQPIAISHHQIKGVLVDIFVAGTDTAAATMIWIMSELIRNPKAMKKAQEEVREIMKGKEMVQEIDLPNLLYLKLVVKEALRLHPPAPLLVPRETTEACMIRGFQIPAKTRVLVNAKSIAMDPTCWENPNEFLPERFLNSSIDYKGQHFEMLPFGVGRRSCPGVNFAMPLVELVLANLLLRFNWELPLGLGIQDLNMEEAIGITMHKRDHLWLRATPFHQ
ncbi:cytochrome P450 71A9-like [Vigna unguiculata]|uniref:Cytochrome P450 n=1 Tax=Vigna unguiculata TaxID=3917 RepID=A0A4D6KXT7_VIGUN|nr:cytochrome P450 71A9-like [Vigna unguiculata]QCD80997.1 cytochrome P450 [Vigna unguiculata]